ncbi:hypothetical protein TTHERM_00449210 (macronuclear) [Tetrahymena thermophila SB210]|uniref:Uncharacterized protein n=1 Tax=Tetrahymena thermophila (strain SB210) TaxID=312017 RepID=Q238Z4_TETTS|nr:hypothetical protein TTHERM_00449210 [Tetrahymena thermophila SB210]EAR93076.2 hypothetical protein TTHERM_00449210 [Tetrahymena thermophila SB210]|eukprot:XP_001013321.2 hypothetical protein TTHERM_00449210 [Tetrahymena thermophila SB210]
MDSNKTSCPICKSKDQVAKVVYGYPARQILQQVQRKEVKLGGCMVPENPKKWYCFNCNEQFN